MVTPYTKLEDQPITLATRFFTTKYDNETKTTGSFYNRMPSKQKMYEGGLLNGVPHGIGILYNISSPYNIIYNGNLKNGKPDGEGTLFYEENKESYIGNFIDGRFNGKGILFYRSKFYHSKKKRYDGEFKDGVPYGKGTAFYDNDDNRKRYEGNLKDGIFIGEGTLFYDNDNNTKQYEGNFNIDGHFNGEAKYFFENKKTRYIGEYKDGKCNGKGTLFYDNENNTKRYIGEYKDGNFNGKGTLFYDNDNNTKQYEGNLKDGNFNGKGTVFYDNEKTRYIGEFKDGKPDGEGTAFYDNNRKKYEGNIKDGIFNGEGILFYDNYDNRKNYEGNFNKDGNFNGKGTLFYDNDNNTKKYEGEFKNHQYHGNGEIFNEIGKSVYKGKFIHGNMKKGVLFKTLNNNTNTNTNKSFDDIKKDIYNLFSSQSKFEEWIIKFTPSVIHSDVHGIYKSIENIHHVFRIIQDITMDEKKEHINNDKDIAFKISNSNNNMYNLFETNYVLNKHANLLYKYLIRKDNFNKSKKTIKNFFSIKKTKNNKDKTCFGIEYSKEIQEMILYSILNSREGLTSQTAKVPIIIMNNTIPPEFDELKIPIKPVKKKKNNEKIYEEKMKKYNKEFENYSKEIKKRKKETEQYEENINLENKKGNYVEVGDTSLNIIRLLDAFLEILPFAVQTDIARAYMIDYIEGYGSKICSFKPILDFNGFLASCGLGNLKKFILSFYNVLLRYVDNNDKNPEIKYIANPIDCIDEKKRLKLFYSSNTEPKSYFNNTETEINDKSDIKKILNGWYEQYLKLENKSYKGFLDYIISQWYDIKCSEYNQNENLIIYNFGYFWKKEVASQTIIVMIDAEIENLVDKYTDKEAYDAAINKIEKEFIEIPECVLDNQFHISDRMFKNVKIIFKEPEIQHINNIEGNHLNNPVIVDEPENIEGNHLNNPVIVDEVEVAEVAHVGGNNFKRLKTKKITQFKKKTKTYKNK